MNAAAATVRRNYLRWVPLLLYKRNKVYAFGQPPTYCIVLYRYNTVLQLAVGVAVFLFLFGAAAVKFEWTRAVFYCTVYMYIYIYIYIHIYTYTRMSMCSVRDELV